jgi:hypothetical protein
MSDKKYWSNVAMKFFTDVCVGIMEDDETHMIYALGLIVKENDTDKDAVQRVRVMGYSITLAEFRQWLPQFMARFGRATRGEE